MQRSPAEPYAAPAMASAAKAEIGIRQHYGVILRSPQRLHASNT